MRSPRILDYRHSNGLSLIELLLVLQTPHKVLLYIAVVNDHMSLSKVNIRCRAYFHSCLVPRVALWLGPLHTGRVHGTQPNHRETRSLFPARGNSFVLKPKPVLY